MSVLISVIVPVYKTEPYLKRCVDSILQQTYRDMEVILVDDGSPDGCPAMCDAYAAADTRVIAIHKANGGVSSARNAGLDFAQGDYVCFVDSDDYLTIDAIAKLYEAAIQTDSAYVVGMCGYADRQAVKNPITQQQTFSICQEPEKLLSYISEDGSYSPYAKLYDARIIQNNTLRFREDMRIAEDTVFIRTYLRYCTAVCLIPHVVYKYNTGNVNSLSKKAYKEYCRLYGEKMNSVGSLLEKLPLPQSRKTAFLGERGINGIKMSVNHYFDAWNDKTMLLQFLADIAEQLLPWVDEKCDEALSKADSWWKRYHRAFRIGNYKKLYRCVKWEKQRQRVRRTIGKALRSVKNMLGK